MLTQSAIRGISVSNGLVKDSFLSVTVLQNLNDLNTIMTQISERFVKHFQKPCLFTTDKKRDYAKKVIFGYQGNWLRVVWGGPRNLLICLFNVLGNQGKGLGGKKLKANSFVQNI